LVAVAVADLQVAGGNSGDFQPEERGKSEDEVE
jgi:hypothetical protein